MDQVLASWGAQEVSALEVYTDIFRLGEGFIQRDGEPSGEHKSNPIIIGSRNGYVIRRIMFEDKFEDLLKEFQELDWAFINGLTYWGKTNKAAAQSKMYAMIFDLDGVDPTKLNAFLSGALMAHVYPVPNYVILSGSGVHLYYVFEQPVDLYPNIKTQLKELKYALTDRMWNRYTSKEEKVQHQGINQGFRLIGGKTKDGAGRVRAFRLSTTPVWLDQLNDYIPDDYAIDADKLWKESRLDLASAKKKYPEWYERRVLGCEPPKTWVVKEDLYLWWLNQIRSGATFGHRYFCIMALAVYAVKCNISEKRLKDDAYSLIPFLNQIEPTAPFTKDDVRSALECFDERYIRFPRNDISKLTGIPIKVNKRNGRRQAKHLAGARAIRDINNENWREGNGRPKGSGTKAALVEQYFVENPTATIRQAAGDLHISTNTVMKWKPK